MGLFEFFKKPKNEIPYEKINKELDTFTTASLAMPKMNNPFLMDDENKHPMIFAYFSGAMNNLSQSYQLNEKDKNRIYTQYLSRNFASDNAEQTEKLLKLSNELNDDDHNRNNILVGELAMKRWKAGGPMAEYAPMGLMRLLKN
jgi:hypothetical protein